MSTVKFDLQEDLEELQARIYLDTKKKLSKKDILELAFRIGSNNYEQLIHEIQQEKSSLTDSVIESVLATVNDFGEGTEKLTDAGYTVQCVRAYSEVIDEICERDFYPGVSLSGRLLVGNENIGLPYVLPFGNAEKWASIPTEWQEPFSQFCIQQTIRLFKAIEHCSGRIVRCCDLARKVIFLPIGSTRYIEELCRFL